MTALGKALHCVFGLLPDKEKEIYLSLASCIKKKMDQLPDVRVQSTMMDSEKGL
jgi:hypothetical protein